jgi:signal recognition particle receptor subunit beta
MSINSATINHASLETSVTVIDCPGHPRLAHLLRQSLNDKKPQGTMMLLDASAIKRDLNAIANTVYSILLTLPRPSHILIVANKSDLFTALPVSKLHDLLESEITSLKRTRDENLDEEEERQTLGGSHFQFEDLDDEGLFVEWTAASTETRQTAGILEWISKRLS